MCVCVCVCVYVNCTEFDIFMIISKSPLKIILDVN